MKRVQASTIESNAGEFLQRLATLESNTSVATAAAKKLSERLVRLEQTNVIG